MVYNFEVEMAVLEFALLHGFYDLPPCKHVWERVWGDEDANMQELNKIK